MTKTSNRTFRNPISNRRPKRRHAANQSLRYEHLENRMLLACDVSTHNLASPTDVNCDNNTTPIDALLVINALNQDGPRSANDGPEGLAPDVNGDGNISPIDALMVINDLNSEGEDDAMARIRLMVTSTDDSSTAITSIGLGENFVLHGLVQDLTGREDGGVFTAYTDVLYDQNLVTANGPFTYGPNYPNGQDGTIVQAEGLLDEVGAFDGFDPLGIDELLLFSIPFTADQVGTVDFTPDPADNLPLHDVGLFGQQDPLAIEEIMYVGTNLQIIGDTAPVAGADSYVTDENTELNVAAINGVLVNDSDPNNDTLTAVLQTQASNGTVSLAADGSFTYTPNADFNGLDTFTYVANDGAENSNPATVTINVRPINAAPVAANDSYSTDEDTTLNPSLGVLSNDTDGDGDNLTVSLQTSTANGSLTLNADGTFSYSPNANFNGSDSFTYVANDGQVDSATATVTITVNPVNDVPVADGNSYSTSKNMPLTIDAASGVLSNDSDIDGDALTSSIASEASNGTVTLNSDGSFTYTPNSDFVGSDSFTYVANDGTIDSQAATVNINVTDPGSTQVVMRLEVTNVSGTPITSIAPGGNFVLSGYVQDVGDLPRDGVFAAYLDVTFDDSLVTAQGDFTFGDSYPNGRSGTVATGLLDEVGAFDGFDPLGDSELMLFSIEFQANQAGTVVFQGDPADILPDHLVLLFNESQGVPSAQIDYGSVSLDIQAGEPPVATDDAYATDEDVTLNVSAANGVLSNDSDPDENETLSAVLVNGPTNGSVTLNADGSFTYTPDANYNGPDAFTYRASDAANFSNIGTVSLTVNSVDDAPVARADSYSLSDADSTLTVNAANGVLRNDFDVEGSPLSVELVSTTSNGDLTLNSDGSFSYTPSSNLVGRDSFTYQVRSGNLVSEIASVSIDVGDLTPSDIVGYVYVDSNNDGVKSARERTLGGVMISLTGTNLLGDEVEQTTFTAADGSYAFEGLLRGVYTVTETQPILMVDGKDTIDGVHSLRNDRFIVDLPAGSVAGDYNFGEWGLEPQFLGNPWFFASRSNNGLFAALDPAGNVAWYCFEEGWANTASVDIDLATNGATLDLITTNFVGQNQTETIRVTGNRNVRIQGDMRNGMLVRLEGTSAEFGVGQTANASEGELDSTAIDQIFMV